jgi:hypothetical protein
MKSYDMRVWEKKHSTCEHYIKNDFSHYKSFNSLEREPFFYCVECCTRWYKNRSWNPEEWDKMINEGQPTKDKSTCQK